MSLKQIEIDGANFSNLNEFYDEVQRCLTSGLDWEISRNLDSFDDVLAGGFGVHDYAEEFELNWINHERSKLNFGIEETIKYLEAKLEKCHPSNKDTVAEDLEKAKKGHGKTLFEIIVEIIVGNPHIKLNLK